MFLERTPIRKRKLREGADVRLGHWGNGLGESCQSRQLRKAYQPHKGGDEDYDHERALSALVMKGAAPCQYPEDPSRECNDEKSPLGNSPAGFTSAVLVKSHEREARDARKGEPARGKFPNRAHFPPARTALALKMDGRNAFSQGGRVSLFFITRTGFRAGSKR